MVEPSSSFLELLRYADQSYSLRKAVQELLADGVPKAQATQQIVEALSKGQVVRLGESQLMLSERERSGW